MIRRRPVGLSAAVSALLMGGLATLPAVSGAFSDPTDTGVNVTAATPFLNYPDTILADTPVIYHRLNDAPTTASTSDAVNSASGGQKGTYNGATDGSSGASGATTRWAFDENTGTTSADSTGNGNTATLAGTATWATGQSGSAVQVPSVWPGSPNNYVQGATGAGIATNADFTLMAWVKTATDDSEQTVLALNPPFEAKTTLPAVVQTNWAAAGEYTVRFITTPARDKKKNSGSSYVDSTQRGTVGTWTHVAVVFDENGATDDMRVYVNGAATSGTTGQTNWDCNDCRLEIGRALWWGTFDGPLIGGTAVDKVATFARALTPAEIASEMSASQPPFQAGQTGALQGPIQGDPSDDAVQFNGLKNVYNTQQMAASKTGTAFTAEAWFKTTTTTGGAIVGHTTTQTSMAEVADAVLYMDDAGKVCFYVDVTEGTNTLCSPASYNDGAWHHVVGGLGGSGQKLFLDSVRVGINTTMKTAKNTAGYWRIGGNNVPANSHTPTNLYFTGLIDEVSIFDKIFSDTLLPRHYYSNF